MGRSGEIKMELNKKVKDASCTNDLRFCAENRECLYGWLPCAAKTGTLMVNAWNLQEQMARIEQGEKFTCIILDDILYLVHDMSKGLKIEEFLQKCRQGLKPGGKFVISISNRIGVPYLAGKSDDYTGRYYDGINCYPDENEPKSFTRSELTELIKKIGMKYIKYFYPYPDQCYVKEIFSDGCFDKYQYGKPYINLLKDKFYLFNESSFYHSIIQEGIAEKLANAFWVIGSEEELDEINNIQYIKLNWDRAERFQISTILKSNGTVEKYALSQAAKEHIKNLYENQKLNPGKGITNLKGEYVSDKLVYPFLEAESLDMLLTKEIERKNKENIISIFTHFYYKLFEGTEETDRYQTDQFVKVFGEEANHKKYHCAAPMNIDLICDNVFCMSNRYEVIDCEWIFPFLIPVEFVIWRAINELYSKHQELSELIERNEFMALFSIDMIDEKVFLEWSSHFAYEYVKSDSVRTIAQEEIPLSLSNLYEGYLKRDFDSYMNSALLNKQFECDRGNGFENQSILQAEMYHDRNYFKVVLKLPKRYDCRVLKWNPIKGRAFHIVIKQLNGAKIAGNNAYKVEKNKYSFLLGDSFFYLLPDKETDTICMEGELYYLDVKEQRKYFQKMQEVYDLQKQELLETGAELERIKAENEKLHMDLESIINSTIWRKTEPLRRFKDNRKMKTENAAEDNSPCAEPMQEQRSIRESVRFCIDEVVLADHMMSIDGWLLCENHGIELSYLILEDEFGIRRQYPFQLKGRKDVGTVLNVRFEGECGIHISANYKSYCAQKIILKILVEREWNEFDTGVYIPSTEDADAGDFFLERYSEINFALDYNECRQQYLGQEKIDCSQWEIDVVVPVYNGMQYLPGLFSSMEKTSVSYRLILIEDCSPDETVRPYLQKYAWEHKNVVLLENNENLGFVKSVNRALRIAEHHVALVNTDVELPEKWLERLMAPIFKDENTASVTPFTNSGTIFSFPDFDKDNKLFMGMTVDQIDKAFSEIRPRYIETPTGVGFCMGMNFHVMQEIGILDEATFEKGYGEENDWCQRAIDAGYKNVYAENLFVHHNHGGSFPSETKKRLLRENAEKLLKKHPNYSGDVARFCKEDPNKQIREYLKFELMFHYQTSFVLVFDHDLGGGASAYLQHKMQEQLSEGNIFGIIRYNMNSARYFLKLRYEDYESEIPFRTRKELVNLLKQRNYKQIWINELATYIELEKWLADIVALREKNAEGLRILIHDYFMICPSLNLMNNEGKYCRLPEDQEVCNACMQGNEFSYSTECASLEKWRDMWRKVLERCDEIIAFSKDSIRLLKKTYPEITSVQLIPHTVEPLEKVERSRKNTNTINIGILGAISEQKGLRIVQKMLKYIEQNCPDMRIIIIGESSEEISSSAFSITGRYVREDIPKLTRENDIDIFFIPSVWPETFSYTTSEIMSMDMPIAVFNLGAPVERVKDYTKGLILEGPEMDTPELVDALYEFAKEQVKSMDS